MPIEGIIEGLKEVARQIQQQELVDYVSDAIEALTDIDIQLDEAYKEGKRQQLEECYEMALRIR